MQTSEYYFIPDTVSNIGGISTSLRAGEQVDLHGMSRVGEEGGYGLAYRIDPSSSSLPILQSGYSSPFLTDVEQGRYLHPLSACLKVSRPKEGMSWDDVRKNVDTEYEQLERAAGASGLVPRPIAKGAGLCAFGEYYGILMEYVPCSSDDFSDGLGGMTLLSCGGDLKNLIRRVTAGGSTLSPLQVAAFAKGLCESLSTLHATGVFHRDIKPNNLIGRAGTVSTRSEVGRQATLESITDVRIIDLGNATHSGADLSIPQEARFASFRYGSPEMLWRELTDNSRSVRFGDMWEARNTEAPDLYAVGCMIYYMYAGRAPFFDDWIQLPKGEEERLRYVIDLKRPGLRLERRLDLTAAERAVEDQLDKIVRATTVYHPTERCAEWGIKRCIREIDDILGIGKATRGERATNGAGGDAAAEKDDTKYDGRWVEQGRKPSRNRQDQRRQRAVDDLGDIGYVRPGNDDSSEHDAEKSYRQGVAAFDHDKALAARCFRAGIKAEHRPSWIALGNMFLSGEAEPENGDEWASALTFCGIEGSGEAWYRLGRSYETGEHGVKRDWFMAFECHSRAHMLGNLDGSVRYGEMLVEAAKLHDDVDNRNRCLYHAEEIFQGIAERGYSAGWFGLGSVYETEGSELYDLDRAYEAYMACGDMKLLTKWLAYSVYGGRVITQRRKANMAGIVLVVMFAAIFTVIITGPDRPLFNQWWMVLLPALVVLWAPYTMLFRQPHGIALAEKSNDCLPSDLAAMVGSGLFGFGLVSAVDTATNLFSPAIRTNADAFVLIAACLALGWVVYMVIKMALGRASNDWWFWKRYQEDWHNQKKELRQEQEESQ